MSTLGQRIRGAREQNQLTQGELGKKLGTSTAVISNWEKDINKPDAEKLPRLCQVLEVSAAYLLDYWEGEDPFTTEEWRRVKQFRLLDSHGKKMVDLVLAEEYARMTRHESDAAGQAGENLTYINCYDANVHTMKALCKKLTGEEEFTGVSPVDAFCAGEDTGW